MTDDPQLRAELDAIDPIVRPLVPRYLDNRRRELVKLEALLAEGKFPELRVIGHDLRGSGGGYGLPTLSALGGRIEDAALAGDGASIGDCIAQIRSFLDRVTGLV